MRHLQLQKCKANERVCVTNLTDCDPRPLSSVQGEHADGQEAHDGSLMFFTVKFKIRHIVDEKHFPVLTIHGSFYQQYTFIVPLCYNNRLYCLPKGRFRCAAAKAALDGAYMST